MLSVGVKNDQVPIMFCHYFFSTLVKKRNSSPFHLQILKLPDGVQASNGVLPNFLKFKLNKRGVSFLGGSTKLISIMNIRIINYWS